MAILTDVGNVPPRSVSRTVIVRKVFRLRRSIWKQRKVQLQPAAMASLSRATEAPGTPFPCADGAEKAEGFELGQGEPRWLGLVVPDPCTSRESQSLFVNATYRPFVISGKEPPGMKAVDGLIAQASLLVYSWRGAPRSLLIDRLCNNAVLRAVTLGRDPLRRKRARGDNGYCRAAFN